MDWTLDLFRDRQQKDRSYRKPGHDNLLSFALLLASDVIGASIGAALRSFVKTPRWHLQLSKNETDGHHTTSSNGHRFDAYGSEASVSGERTPTAKLGLPFDSVDSVNVSQEPAILSIKGLKNKGQTCYANSIFQSLASLQPFCRYLQQLQRNENISVARELYQTIQHINGHEIGIRPRKRLPSLLDSLNSTSSPIRNGDPYKVLNIVAKYHSQFRSRNGMFAGTSEQQDAHEFFIALMDVISTEENDRMYDNMSSTKIDTMANEEDMISLAGDKIYLEKQIAKRSRKTTSDKFIDVDEEEKKHDNHDQCRIANTEVMRLDKSEESEALKTCDLTTCPFDGWSGSTIKCNSCYHIRPIRTAPFVALTLPIINSSSNALENFLLLEYGGFKTAERVSDVLCLACAIQNRLRVLEDEEIMLKGAISRIKRRKKAIDTKVQPSMNESDNDIIGLVKESERLKISAAQLRSLDPDADEDSNDANPMDEIELIGTIDKSISKLKPIRGDAWKATLIMRPPKVLCIHIQRRHFDYRTGQMVKLRKEVDFSETMHLPDSHAMYRLMSVVEHQGGAFGGHYVTYRRTSWDITKNEWVLVSDQRVSSRNWNDVKKCQAYLLFYEVI